MFDCLSGPFRSLVLLGLALPGLIGCGDNCEVLCQNVGARVATCKPAALTWNDLGARSRNDFVNQCRRQWDRERIGLSASNLRLSLEACGDTNQGLQRLSCEEIVALFGPSP